MVLYDTYRLSLQMCEVVESPGEEDSAEIRDIEATSFAVLDQSVAPQRIQNRTTPIWKRRLQQIEVSRVVKAKQDILTTYMFGGNVLFKSYPIKHAPERSFFLGIIFEPSPGTSHANKLHSAKGDWLMYRAINLQEHNAPPAYNDFVKPEFDAWPQHLQQPGL